MYNPEEYAQEIYARLRIFKGLFSLQYNKPHHFLERSGSFYSDVCTHVRDAWWYTGEGWYNNRDRYNLEAELDESFEGGQSLCVYAEIWK